MSAVVIPDEATCVQCNYSLRGLSDFRCPECGRAFDPDRPLTMNLGRPLDRFAKAALRPMGRLPRTALWAIVTAGFIGPAWLFPADGVAILWLLLWLAFFTGCWLRSMVRRAVAYQYRQPKLLLRVDDPFRRKTRLAFIVSTILVLSRAPFVVAILGSRPWLDAYAYHLWAEVPATEPLPSGPVIRGAVVVREVTAGGDGVTLLFYGGEIGYVRTNDGQGLRIDWWSWNPRIAEL